MRDLSSLRILASSLAAELAHPNPQPTQVRERAEALARMVGIIGVRCEGCPDREETYAEMTQRVVIRRWRKNRKNVLVTAKSLGLGRSTVYRWLREWGEVRQSIASWRGIYDEAS